MNFRTGTSYVFPDRRVRLTFSRCSDEKVHVTYLSGRGLNRLCHEHVKTSVEKIRQSEQKDGLKHKVHDVGVSAKKLVVGSFSTAGTVAGGALERAKVTAENLPIIKQVQSAADQRVEQGQREANRQAQKLNDLKAPEFLKTNR